MQILNSDKEEDYFHNVINGILLKFISYKTSKINEKVRAKIDIMFENLNTLSEMKKYTNQMKRQFTYLLKDKKGSADSKKVPDHAQEVINPFLNQKNSQKDADFSSTSNLEDYTQSPYFPEFKYHEVNQNLQNIPSFNTRKNNLINKIENMNVNSLSTQEKTRSVDGFSFYNQNPNNNYLNHQNAYSDNGDGRERSHSKSSIFQKIENNKLNLTNQVWPKTRTLLSITSKMFREKMISHEQRGILKELVLDQNPNLYGYLSVYESNNNYKLLYENIIKLISRCDY